MELIRNFNDWEITEYESLLTLLSPSYLSESNDQSVWSLNAVGTFTVKFLFYNYLVKNDSIELSFLKNLEGECSS